MAKGFLGSMVGKVVGLVLVSLLVVTAPGTTQAQEYEQFGTCTVRITRLDARSIGVKWSPCTMKKYEVCWKVASDSGTACSNNKVSTQYTNETITSLHPATRYNVQVWGYGVRGRPVLLGTFVTQTPAR